MTLLIFLFAAALGVVVALMAMMGLFLGASGPDLRGLLIIELVGLVPVILGTTFYLVRLKRAYPEHSVVKTVWDRIPGWVILAFCLVFSLVIVAELAVFLVNYLSGVPVNWEYYIPIVGGTVYAVCFCCLFATHQPEPLSSTAD